MSNPHLWVRNETFDHGVFNTSIRWTVPKVLDFLGSLRVVVASMNIVRATWIKVTTTRCKPTLTESEAAAYWHTFAVLQDAVLGRRTDWIEIRIIGILLLCQVFSPYRGRTDHIAKSVESWPSLAQERAHSSGGMSSPRQSPRSAPRSGIAQGSGPQRVRGRELANAVLGFVRQNFGCFIQIACFSLTSEPQRVTAEEFDLLGLVLCAGSSFQQPFARLSEGIPDLSSRRSLTLSELQQSAEDSLVWNEEVYALNLQNAQHHAIDGDVKSATISGMHKTTYFQRESDCGCHDLDYLSILFCTDCTIYVTQNIRCVFITGCHECTIVMGAVSCLCTVQNCEKMSLHVAAHCFKVENCIDSSAYLYCHLPPILTGDTRGIMLAPFNAMHSEMNEKLARCGMQLEREHVDEWAHPISCTLGSHDETIGSRSGSLEETQSSTYHFVNPAAFHPVLMPEADHDSRMQARNTTLVLPQVYSEAFAARGEEMRSLHHELASMPAGPQRESAQMAICGHFRAWLQSTGRSRQLADLARMGPSLTQTINRAQ